MCRFAFSTFADVQVVALGWGTLEFSGPMSAALQKVDLNVVSNARCETSYPTGAVTAAQLCAFARGKDTCQVRLCDGIFILNLH